MVTILTGQAEVRPELALAILERKFPRRWAKVTVVAAPPQHLTFNVADILQKVQERIAQGRAQGQLRPSSRGAERSRTARHSYPEPGVIQLPAEAHLFKAEGRGGDLSGGEIIIGTSSLVAACCSCGP